LDELSGEIEDTYESFEVRGRPDLLWSTAWNGISTGYFVLAGLVLLLGLEWGVRKGFKLL
jgi:hypothetical protein